MRQTLTDVLGHFQKQSHVQHITVILYLDVAGHAFLGTVVAGISAKADKRPQKRSRSPMVGQDSAAPQSYKRIPSGGL